MALVADGHFDPHTDAYECDNSEKNGDRVVIDLTVCHVYVNKICVWYDVKLFSDYHSRRKDLRADRAKAVCKLGVKKLEKHIAEQEKVVITN